MRITTSGSWTAEVEREIARGKAAVTEGVRAATLGAQMDLRQKVERALGRKMGNAVGSAVYPKGGASFGAAGVVSARGPGADLILDAFSADTVVTPKAGRFLAIPTGYNKPQGQRMKSAKPSISAAEMAAMKGWTYTRPTQDGRGLVWFLRVAEAQAMGKGGRVRSMAYAGGMRLVGGGRRGRTDPILEAGAVPMFLLLPMARLGQRYDAAATMRNWADRVPDLIARAMPEG